MFGQLLLSLVSACSVLVYWITSSPPLRTEAPGYGSRRMASGSQRMQIKGHKLCKSESSTGPAREPAINSQCSSFPVGAGIVVTAFAVSEPTRGDCYQYTPNGIRQQVKEETKSVPSAKPSSARLSEQARHTISGRGKYYVPLATARSRVEERGLTEESEHAA